MTQPNTAGQGRAVPLAVAALLMIGISSAAAPVAGQGATTAPASQPAGPVVYQPGVSIDWAQRQVLLAGEVVLRSGDLELFACAPRSKEHESIVRMHGRPLHIYQALGLAGFEPGRPAYYDNNVKRVIPATGQRLEIGVRWRQDGRTRTVPIEEWMFDKRRRVVPGPMQWVFAGSVPIDDDQILADLEGTVLCVVDFDGAIIAVGSSHSSDNADLWLSANTEQIPPPSTPVTLIVQAARPRLVFQVDRFGRLGLDGQPAGLRQFIEAARQAQDKATGVVQFDPAVADIRIREILSALRQAGLSEITSEPIAAEPAASAAASQRTEVEEEGLAILETVAHISRQLPAALDAVATSVEDTYRRLSERARAAGQAAAGAARAFGGVPGPASRPVGAP